MQVNNIPHKTMTGREANKQYSQQLKLPNDYLCVFEEWGGILRAAKAVATLQVVTISVLFNCPLSVVSCLGIVCT